MAMIIDESKNILKFIVPNSEASVDAQHNGIVDRTVGSYYMSERYDDCLLFLSSFNGEYYIDIEFCIKNAKEIISELKKYNLENAFKSKLLIQENSILALEWYTKENDNFYAIDPPTVNENRKYLKLNNEDDVLNLIKTLLLGDLTNLCIKKIGMNGYILYLEKNEKLNQMIENGEIRKWMMQ